MRKTLLAALLCGCFITSFTQPQLSIQQFASGLTTPVAIAHAGDDRLFVLEVRGRIKIVSPQGVVTGTFLDISDRVNQDPQDHGLIGLAFHPDYANNGYFYVHYVDSNINSNISRFKVSANPNVAIAASEDKLITVAHPFRDHYGGDLAFGPDGYLYFVIGDGHTQSDPGIYAQDLTTLLGKMSRIDVDTASGYKIPPTNPFINNPNARPEIWSSGFRNPWRFSFDRHTHDLWISDVGQSAWEEISMEPAGSPGGLDYGWPCYEGSHSFDTAGCNGLYVQPVHDYPNTPSFGCSVIGGYVYRGCKSRELYGHYIFTDYCSGKLWTLYSTDSSRTWTTTDQGQYSTNRFSSFGEDAAGELYLVELFDGKIFKIVAADSTIDASLHVPDSMTICPGDSVALGFSSPFTHYTWMRNGVQQDTTGTFYAKDAGVYHAEVMWNGGCTATSDTLTLFQYSQPVVAVFASDTTACPGDTVMLTSVSVESFVSYQWSNGDSVANIVVTQPGSYFVEVTDTNGCKGQSPTVQIIGLSVPVPVISGDTSFCEGDSISLATGTYVHYEWTTGDSTATIHVNQGGTYSVEVVDTNSCRGQSAPVTITMLPLPAVSLLPANDTAICSDDTLTISVNGAFSTYAWSTGETGSQIAATASDVYNVTVQDANGCESAADGITVTVLPVPLSPELYFNGGRIESSVAGQSYEWYLDGTLLPLENQQSIPPYEPGSYSVLVTDSSGCSTLSDEEFFNWYGIATTVLDGISIYPNPFENEILIMGLEKTSGNLQITLLDITGKEMLVREVSNSPASQMKLDLEKLQLASGFYFVRVELKKASKTFKVTKR